MRLWTIAGTRGMWAKAIAYSEAAATIAAATKPIQSCKDFFKSPVFASNRRYQSDRAERFRPVANARFGPAARHQRIFRTAGALQSSRCRPARPFGARSPKRVSPLVHAGSAGSRWVSLPKGGASLPTPTGSASSNGDRQTIRSAHRSWLGSSDLACKLSCRTWGKRTG